MTDLHFPSETWLTLLRESAGRSNELHRKLLTHRAEGLQGTRALIELQIKAAGEQYIPTSAPRTSVFTSEQIDAFGTGRISDCLGPEFAKYDAMQIPRIPNGELKMMSRIVEINGQAHDFSTPAWVTAEYDVPEETWYLRDSPSHQMPFSVLMEIAMQPCGFLSAYLELVCVSGKA